MNHNEIHAALSTITPDTPPEAVEELITQLDDPSTNKAFVTSAVQRLLALTDLSGMRALADTFDRRTLLRVAAAKQLGLFDWGRLVIPRKDASGREEGTYTFPNSALSVQALEFAEAQDWGALAELLPSLLPDPQHTGGVPVTLDLVVLCPRATAPAKPAAAKKTPAKKAGKANPADAEPAKSTAPPPTSNPTQETAVTETPADKDATMNQLVELGLQAFQRELLPGFARGFSATGRALRGISQLGGYHAQYLDALAKRQDKLHECLTLVLLALDPNADIPQLPPTPAVPQDAVASLAEALNELTTTSETVEEHVTQETVAPPPAAVKATAAARAPTPAATTPPPADKPKATPAPAKAAKAAGGAAYTAEDLANMDPNDIDLTRVDFSETALSLNGYDMPALQKILEAFGETGGQPVRGLRVKRIKGLHERWLAEQGK